MKRIIILLALAVICVAEAKQWVYEDENVKVRLTSDACETASLIKMLTLNAPDPKIAFVMYEGRNIDACWVTLQGPGAVLLMDKEGDAGVIPLGLLKFEPGI